MIDLSMKNKLLMGLILLVLGNANAAVLHISDGFPIADLNVPSNGDVRHWNQGTISCEYSQSTNAVFVSCSNQTKNKWGVTAETYLRCGDQYSTFSFMDPGSSNFLHFSCVGH